MGSIIVQREIHTMVTMNSFWDRKLVRLCRTVCAGPAAIACSELLFQAWYMDNGIIAGPESALSIVQNQPHHCRGVFRGGLGHPPPSQG